MTEFARSDDVRIGRYTANTFEHRQLFYAVIGGDAILEGDIVLGSVAEIEAVSSLPEVRKLQPEGIAIKGEQFRWPGGRIPYRIHPDFPRRERVLDAINHWEERTSRRISFILLDTSNLNEHPDRVLFANGGNCSSQVGRRGLQQVITLGVGCEVGQAIHEIGHCVGLWHEQSRKDRDDFVTVNKANIRPGDEHNFVQRVRDGEDIEDYDYESIMHYPRTAFSRDGQPTIVPKKDVEIGQRRGLSDGDLAAVKSLYP